MTHLRDRLQSTLGPSYTLERELGGGGMAHVFVAEDARLRCKVVVKVLSPSLAEGLSAERFEREIVLAARLQHPNIVPLLSTGESDGLPYYTMPFVRGETLRARLDQGSAFSLVESISILRDVARALAYAHLEGVIHRDIKPENILLSGDVAVVADFGIAKAVDAARSRGVGGTLTQLGASLGTPAYMSPEQAAADPTVDARADLYAWGVVAYEVLSGAHPFAGKRAAHELIMAHMIEKPAPIVAKRADLPVELADFVMRCLEKDPELRPRSAGDIVAVLGAVGTSSSGAQVVSSPAAGSRTAAPSSLGSLSTPTLGGTIAPSIAVLPFANMSADADNEYFADGITEEILSVLAQVRGIRVASRTSSFALKGQRTNVREVAEQLGVTTVLEGSVRKAGTRVRITTQLVSAADGMHLWSERFDRELADIFAVQDEIAQHVAKALEATLAGGGNTPPAGSITMARAEPRGQVNPEAYDLFLHARQLLAQKSSVGTAEAMACLERSVELDPEFALGWAWLSTTMSSLAFYNVIPPLVAFPKARELAERALALEPTNAYALVSLGVVQLFHDWDVEAARKTATAAMAAAPGLYYAHMGHAWVQIASGQPREALAALDRAYAADPHDVIMFVERPLVMYLAGDFERAAAEVRRGLALYPGHGEMHRQLGNMLMALGDMRGALHEFEIALPLTQRNPWTLTDLVIVRAKLGDRDGAREILVELEAKAATAWVPPMALALARAALDGLDAGFDALEQSLEVRDFWLIVMYADPYFREFALDPRFTRLLARIRPRR